MPTLKSEQVYRVYYPDSAGDKDLKIYSDLAEYKKEIEKECAEKAIQCGLEKKMLKTPNCEYARALKAAITGEAQTTDD